MSTVCPEHAKYFTAFFYFLSSNRILIPLWEMAIITTILWMKKLTFGKLTQLVDAGAGSQALLFEYRPSIITTSESCYCAFMIPNSM